MSDKYKTFEQLKSTEGTKAFKIQFADRGSSIVIATPHGGKIEYGTSEITRGISGEKYSYYIFEGKKRSSNKDLHITSSNFDEPICRQLLKKAEIILTVHGKKGTDMNIYIGGLHTDLKNTLRKELISAGFNVKKSANHLAGAHPNNICNIGQEKKGVQLEICRGLRNSIVESIQDQSNSSKSSIFNLFCKSINKGLNNFQKKGKDT